MAGLPCPAVRAGSIAEARDGFRAELQGGVSQWRGYTALVVDSRVLAVVGGVLLAGCASGPNVLVLPGPGKTLDQFRADDVACRAWVHEQPGTTSDWRYDIAYMQCMYTKGNQVPGQQGSQQPSYMLPAPPDIPPPPAGIPPPPPPAPSR